jgi:hypothetical protein
MKKKLPTAHPSPKGFISVRDAWLQTVAAVYPENLDRVYDKLNNEKSRDQHAEIATKLENALQEGRLQGVSYDAEKKDIPADWWPNEAHVTAGQTIKDGTIIVIRESDLKRWQRDQLNIDVSVTGRPKGTGINDADLLSQMNELIQKGECKTPNAAAIKVASFVTSSEGELKTVSDRLGRKYRNSNKH